MVNKDIIKNIIENNKFIYNDKCLILLNKKFNTNKEFNNKFWLNFENIINENIILKKLNILNNTISIIYDTILNNYVSFNYKKSIVVNFNWFLKILSNKLFNYLYNLNNYYKIINEIFKIIDNYFITEILLNNEIIISNNMKEKKSWYFYINLNDFIYLKENFNKVSWLYLNKKPYPWVYLNKNTVLLDINDNLIKKNITTYNKFIEYIHINKLFNNQLIDNINKLQNICYKIDINLFINLFKEQDILYNYLLKKTSI